MPFTISIEPAEAGKVVYAPLAPPAAGGPAKGQLALKILVTNTGTEAMKVIGVKLSFKRAPGPVSFLANLDVAPGATEAWLMAPPYFLLPQPAPASITVAVSASGVAAPVTKTLPLAA